MNHPPPVQRKLEELNRRLDEERAEKEALEQVIAKGHAVLKDGPHPIPERRDQLARDILTAKAAQQKLDAVQKRINKIKSEIDRVYSENLMLPWGLVLPVAATGVWIIWAVALARLNSRNPGNSNPFTSHTVPAVIFSTAIILAAAMSWARYAQGGSTVKGLLSLAAIILILIMFAVGGYALLGIAVSSMKSYW